MIFQGNGTATEQRAIGAMMQRAEKRLTFLQSTGEERAKLVAEQRRESEAAMELVKRMQEPPVVDPDAPTVTVLDFDKTATYGQPMHFKVVITGSVPVREVLVDLSRTPMGGSVISAPSFGSMPPSRTTDVRAFTEFTIVPKCTGNCVVGVQVKDEQGRTARWVAGTVVVKPADVK